MNNDEVWETAYRAFTAMWESTPDAPPDARTRGALAAYRDALEAAGLVPPRNEPPDMAVIRHAATVLAKGANFPLFEGDAGVERVLSSEIQVNVAYSAAMRHLGRIGGDNSARTTLEWARRVLCTYHQDTDAA